VISRIYVLLTYFTYLAKIADLRVTAMELAANQSKTMSQSGAIHAFVNDISV